MLLSFAIAVGLLIIGASAHRQWIARPWEPIGKQFNVQRQERTRSHGMSSLLSTMLAYSGDPSMREFGLTRLLSRGRHVGSSRSEISMRAPVQQQHTLAPTHISASDLQLAIAGAFTKRLGSGSADEYMKLAQELLDCELDTIFSIQQGANIDAFADALVLHHLFTSPQSNEYLRIPLQQALQVLGNALRLYGERGVFTSFNGGKDAVVILHLSRAAMANYCLKKRIICKARTIFFKSEDEFPEVLQFINETELSWDIEILRTDAGFVEGLRQCIDEEGGNPLGFVLGTRKGDPNCGEQAAFEPSSDWMPPFMRVNPIVEWDYGHIWHFLRLFQLPYCVLYDQGYTSLGSRVDSWPNPVLRKIVAGVPETDFWPAYMLSDWALERAGRVKRDCSTPECNLVDIEARMSRARKPRSAALIVIGDEVLKGKCCDTNGPFAAKELRAAGVPLQRIVTVPDDRDLIMKEIRACMQNYDLVVTSGGLGPTHDDVTMHALADALGQKLQLNSEMEAHLRKVYSLENSAKLPEEVAKLAQLPPLSRLLWPPSATSKENQKWPTLQCDNVLVLPGVPQLFESHLSTVVENFVETRKLHTFKVVLGVDERSIVAVLNEVVDEHPAVIFGSYPFARKDHYPKTTITLEGGTPDLVDTALEGLIRRLPDSAVLRVEQDDTLN